MAARVRAACPSATFVVAADETRGPLDVGEFRKFSHTDDFSALGLPSIAAPPYSILWWNADYVVCWARTHFPDHDYIVMLEYDVHVTCNLDEILDRCARERVDMAATGIHRMSDGWARTIVDYDTGEIWWAFLPLLILSARAIDALLAARFRFARQRAERGIETWPYCEVFIPTVLKQDDAYNVVELSTFADAALNRHRPFLSAIDPQLVQPNLIAHPVLHGARFVRACLAGQHRSLVLSDGRLADMLEPEGIEILALHARIERNEATGYLELRPVLKTQHKDNGMPETLIDVAHRKPATQSSHSQWSRGETAEDDAALAVAGYLLDDYAFHTAAEQDPWWQVDLLQPATIDHVEILNRATQPSRFRRFRILGSLDGSSWHTFFAKDDHEEVSGDPAAPAIYTAERPFTARYMRIVLQGVDFLHLRRVRVFGRPAGSESQPETPAAPDQQGPNGQGPDRQRANEQGLTAMVTDVIGSPLFAGAVASVVNRQMFGLSYDSYNIDALAALAAGIDSSQYAVAHMAKAARCQEKAALFDLAIPLVPQAGLILEFGVFSGQTINYLAERFHTRILHGFDSFQGLPETWRAGFETGAFARNDLPPVHANVELVVGWFDRTLPTFLDAHPSEPIALLHIDCDLYSSTQTVFAQCASRIVPGTVILFDEYFNYPGWRLHEYKAFQEFVASRGIHYDYIGLVPHHQQVAVRIVGVR